MRWYVSLLILTACGARTQLGAPLDAGPADATTDVEEERDCAFDCYIGHQCCVGGCNGPPAPMPNDCCSCLPGEISSLTCNGSSKCGP